MIRAEEKHPSAPAPPVPHDISLHSSTGRPHLQHLQSSRDFERFSSSFSTSKRSVSFAMPNGRIHSVRIGAPGEGKHGSMHSMHAMRRPLPRHPSMRINSSSSESLELDSDIQDTATSPQSRLLEQDTAISVVPVVEIEMGKMST